MIAYTPTADCEW